MIKDMILPAAVTLLVGSMVVPLPAPVLDLLLAANLIIALVLLLTSFYVSDTLKLSSLPTLLLLTTLTRLSLNISTSRLILSSGRGGEVVEAFGEVVVGGNLVVGAIIFVVITLVQFMVVAKGAERVAEVSARFALDAMPGKQMAIDADLRAGILDLDGAKKKRSDLQAESRFYGSLDGAMKFVKGDAIAGIMIAGINAVGGLILGVVYNGYDLQSALSKYTLLTVGDGLLSQIPAFLSAVAAGVVVTRVARDENVSLAREIPLQLFQVPQVRLAIGITSMGISLLPGMPFIPFFLFGVILVGTFPLNRKEVDSRASLPSFEVKTQPLVVIRIPEKWISSPDLPEAAHNALEEKRRALFEEEGLLFSIPEIRVVDDLTPALLIRGVPVGRARGVMSCQELANEYYAVLKERKSELIDDVLTRRLLDLYDRELSELITSLIPEVITLTQLTGILKSLCDEDVSVRNLDIILQSIAENAPRVGVGRQLLEEVRVALRRVISHCYEDEVTGLECVELDPLLEIACGRAEREQRVLETGLLQQLLQFGESMKELMLPLVVSKESRRLIREYLSLQGVHLSVLAREEVQGCVLRVRERYFLQEREAVLEELAVC